MARTTIRGLRGNLAFSRLLLIAITLLLASLAATSANALTFHVVTQKGVPRGTAHVSSNSDPSLPAPATSNEFKGPSWTELPAVSPYNTTPSCPLSAANGFDCEVPSSALPPIDQHNPERYLNSAYWPAEKRPDVEYYAIQQYGYNYSNCSNNLPHYCFLVDAETVGYPVSHTPQPGDLWLAPGECLTFGGPGAPLPSGCNDTANDWYLGYVEQVFPDDSFIQSWGGSSTPADSGIGVTWFSGAMDPYTSFIHLMAPGTPEPSPGPSRGGDGHSGGRLSAKLRIFAVKIHGSMVSLKLHLRKGAEGQVIVIAKSAQSRRLLHAHGAGSTRRVIAHLAPGYWELQAFFVPADSAAWTKGRARHSFVIR